MLTGRLSIGNGKIFRPSVCFGTNFSRNGGEGLEPCSTDPNTRVITVFAFKDVRKNIHLNTGKRFITQNVFMSYEVTGGLV
jgi:hypothetical protein